MEQQSNTEPITAVRGVCEVQVVSARGGPADPVRLLIEVPHGATGKRHFDAIRERLSSDLPDRLQDFFFVNTDVGAFECASAAARMIGERASGCSILILRSLIPRTFIDCNRIVENGTDLTDHAVLTPAIPDYVSTAEDRALLERLHRAYHDVAARAYRQVCGEGGLALQLHTYAPRSVRIERIDGDIVRALHRAYEPGTYESWEKRPDVDIISEAGDRTRLAPATWVDSIKAHYARLGLEAGENATYRLHPSTWGYRHANRYPDRVLCLELSRARLADPFTPFREMQIAPSKVEMMSEPIAAAFLDELALREVVS